MFASLPKHHTEFMHCSWEQLEPFFTELSLRSLDSSNVEAWLRDWSRLGEIIHDIFWRLYVGITVDTTDSQAEARYQRFLEQVYPQAQAAEQQLKEKLLASGLEPAGFATPLKNMRTEAEIFRPANLPLLSKELKLSSEYDRLIGAQTVAWDGEEVTLTELQKVYQAPDREQRQHAWQLAAQRQLADRRAIDALWIELMQVRGKLAENAGFSNYRDYRWKQLLRLDYTPADCARFHQAIEQVAVPAALRLYKRRRHKLGLDALRPWDLNVDVWGLPALRPFKQVEELERKVAAIFQRIDPALGEHFEVMRRERLLDLDNRKGKAPGGYCTEFLVERRPYIFMNAVGIHEDVLTLLHEGGHAFHIFEAAHLPYVQQFQYSMEFGEVASTSMELLSFPYLTSDQGGFYSTWDAARACIEYLEALLLFWPYMAVVDAFQHWVYENHSLASDPAHCDAHWDELWQRFMPGVDWSGLDAERLTGWQRKLHILQAPFYYVEYGLAQLGALQVWRNARQDQAAAIAAYRQALALGGTVSIPELYAAAGICFGFDVPAVQLGVDLIESAIHELETIVESA
ncbi:MAG: M3 family oligoendopeptidase [Chloroflexota bacterium]